MSACVSMFALTHHMAGGYVHDTWSVTGRVGPNNKPASCHFSALRHASFETSSSVITHEHREPVFLFPFSPRSRSVLVFPSLGNLVANVRSVFFVPAAKRFSSRSGSTPFLSVKWRDLVETFIYILDGWARKTTHFICEIQQAETCVGWWLNIILCWFFSLWFDLKNMMWCQICGGASQTTLFVIKRDE